MDIKVISFDIGNTIYKSNKLRIKESLAKMFEIDVCDFKPIYQKIFDYTNVPLEIKVQKLCEHFNKLENYQNVLFCINEAIRKCKVEYVDNKIDDFIKKLKIEGYILICISKSSNIYGEIEGQETLKLFDRIYRTSDLELSKKDFALYSFVESELHVKASQIIHIGDSYLEDFIYPQMYGLNTILYNNPQHQESCFTLNEIYKKICDLKKQTY